MGRKDTETEFDNDLGFKFNLEACELVILVVYTASPSTASLFCLRMEGRIARFGTLGFEDEEKHRFDSDTIRIWIDNDAGLEDDIDLCQTLIAELLGIMFVSTVSNRLFYY